MRSRALLLLFVVVAVSAIPQTAGAKGATRATITGPSLESPIEIGRRQGADLYTLANRSGIYSQLFESELSELLDGRPGKALGPRYDVAYLMRVPNRKANVVHQDLYPYAKPHPVTYVEPGQPIFGRGARTLGGWYQAGPGLLPYLVSKGLPAPKGYVEPAGKKPKDSSADENEEAAGAAAPQAPAPQAPAPPAAPRSTGDSSAGGWMIGAALVLAVLIAFAGTRMLLRRREIPSTQA